MESRSTPADETVGFSTLLPRRVGAGLVDLAIMALMAAGAAVATATRVPAIAQPDGSVDFSAVDRQLINDMTGSFSRGHLIGDTLWAFSATDVATVAAAAVMAGIIVGAIVPWFAGGRSPGKILFGLRVVTVDGRTPGVFRHLVRTLASVADLMPLVVPGLTGYAFAASNPHNQRIGDRLARTLVVDRLQVDDSSASVTRMSRIDEAAASGPIPEVAAGSIGARTHARADSSLNRPAERPDQVDMSDRGSASGQSVSQPPPVATERIPVEQRPNNPYPKPRRPSRPKPDSTARADFDSLTLPESSLSDMPLTKSALFEALGLEPAANSEIDSTDPNDHPSEQQTPSRVQGPTPVSADLAAETAEEAAPAAPTLTATIGAKQASIPVADNRAPIWSEDWEAWIYWDIALKGWFRFDVATGNWVTLNED